MNKEEFIKNISRLFDDEEYEAVIEAVMSLPDKSLDDEILGWLAKAYMQTGEYKKAIAVLDGQRERLDGDYMWHIRMGTALVFASGDEECEEDDDLRRRILERAQSFLARGMNMNPPEDVLESADKYMEYVEGELDVLDGCDDEDGDEYAPEMYEPEEIEAVEDHIKEYFGDFPTVFHELVSPDIHCDIYIIPPSEEKNYYTLITVGMGAHIMTLPEELSAEEQGRCELLICLPPDWKLGETAEEWFWPIALLKNLARLPINCDTWLGWGHSVDHRDGFSPNTRLCGSLLVYPENVESGANECLLPSGEVVNFFEIIPIYREEMSFKTENDARALLEKMNGVSHIVDPFRKNVCEGYDTSSAPGPIDCSQMHSDKIREKDLPIGEINGCSHIAIFLRWCILHGLSAPEFEENCPEIYRGVKEGKITDLREFIDSYFGGELYTFQLNFLGAEFARYYYDWDRQNSEHFFPADVDDCAEKYFGTEKYNSEEFKDEAYLFVPFDEDYYARLSKYIEAAYNDFYPEFSRFQNFESEAELRLCERLLGCECVLVKDPEKTAENMKELLSEGRQQGFIPLLIACAKSYEEFVDEAELAFVLRDSLNTFLEPLVIAKAPVLDEEEMSGWLRGKFCAKKPVIYESEEITKLCERTAKEFKTAPAVLLETQGRTMFFLQTSKGRYLKLESDGSAKQ